MNESNLIPLDKQSLEKAKEIRSKGGLALKGIPKYTLTRCKNCKLECPLKADGIKNWWRCKIPDYKRHVLELQHIPGSLDKALVQVMHDMTITATSFREKDMLLSKLLEYKRITQPQELNINQQSVNVNANIDIQAMMRIAEESKRRRDERARAGQ